MKKTIDMTNEDLQAYFKEHVVYEYNMLIQTADLLVNQAFGQHSIIHNALVESFALHARNLIQFFSAQKRRDTDVCAAHYLPPGVSFALAEDLESEENQANKQIAHLTTGRSQKPEEKSWDLSKITRVLANAFRNFVTVADEEKLPTHSTMVSYQLRGHANGISSSPLGGHVIHVSSGDTPPYSEQ